MDGTFIKELVDNVTTKAFDPECELPGSLFSRPVFHAPLPQEPLAEPLKVHSLQAFTRYLTDFRGGDKGRSDNGIGVPSAIVVQPNEVRLVSAVFGVRRQRESLCVATLDFTPFAFGQWHEQEQFNIALQSLFQTSGDLPTVQRVSGTLKQGSERISMDNGITQKVTASAGITLADSIPVPNPVLLRPYRTFADIVEQPQSLFVFRVQGGDEKTKPRLALFEADGGRWKQDACSAICRYLESELATAGLAIPLIG